MVNKINHRKLVDLVKYPIITDKTTKLIEDNQYCFVVEKQANKIHIKQAIEYIFNVRIKKINTLNKPPKKRRIGKFIGKKANHKKAIVKLYDKYTINLFSEN
uniref:Large ribosomal subunit protein uL23c n=1 Tax=Schimmelmannia schousboei TaxID=173468 RepID=A0A1C9C924_9FLOR|nr:ribosomal protein L23 [Schimmelmannia schousboei]AOM64881.1 ribosomal protein L23 [Schimmelmannia schousboei]